MAATLQILATGVSDRECTFFCLTAGAAKEK